MRGIETRLLWAAFAILFASALFGCGQKQKLSRDDPVLEKPVEELSVEDMSRMVAVVETNYGVIKFAIHPQWGHRTCRHFIKLVKQGFYDGLAFHEIKKGIWIVGGDPEGDGSEALEYTIPLELPTGRNVRGAVGMYHPLDMPNNGGSQFYIMLRHVSSMDGGYAVFGKVVEGMEVVDRIAGLPATPPGGKPRAFMPLNEVVIKELYLMARPRPAAGE